MDPMNLLVVEQGADWAHWSSTSHLVGHAMLVLAQHGDEPAADFRERIRNKLSRIKKQGLKSVVLLRGRGRPAPASDELLRELELGGAHDFRVYPAERARRSTRSPRVGRVRSREGESAQL